MSAAEAAPAAKPVELDPAASRRGGLAAVLSTTISRLKPVRPIGVMLLPGVRKLKDDLHSGLGFSK